jgi:hypothetical protein
MAAHPSPDLASADLRALLAAIAPRGREPLGRAAWPLHDERPGLSRRPDASHSPLWNARRDRAHPPVR